MVKFRYDSVVWRRTRREVLERDGGRCRIGGPRCRVDAVEVHHRIAIAVGGSIYDPDNLIAVCRVCHLATRKAPVWRPSSRWATDRVKPSREW